MPGESSRSIQYRKPAEQAFDDVVTAIENIGTLHEASDLTMTVAGKVRYGLQAVKLRVSIHEKDEKSCTLEIQAFADDLFGGGARKGTDKLIAELQKSRGSETNHGRKQGNKTRKNVRPAGCLGMILLAFVFAVETVLKSSGR